MSRLYIDIEGQDKYPVEVGLICADISREGGVESKILDATCLYGEIVNQRDFINGRNYCHGMAHQYLTANGLTQKQLRMQTVNFIIKHAVKDIYGFGSDNLRFLENCWSSSDVGDSTLPNYHNIQLPGWIERSEKMYHKVARTFKQQGVRLCEGKTGCPYQTVHPLPIRISARNPAIRTAKEKHGAHCALYDALELVLFHGLSVITI